MQVLYNVCFHLSQALVVDAALFLPLYYCVHFPPCTELTAQDCLFMGKHAFNAGAYARAVEWFEESYILAGLENNKTIRQDQVMEFIQHAINMVCIDF